MFMFTVILICPDYVGTYGECFDIEYVNADTVDEAIEKASAEASQSILDTDGKPYIAQEDFNAVAVFHGFQPPITQISGVH